MCETYFWLSNTQLLLITNTRDERPGEYFASADWRGHADLINLRTDSTTRLVGLTRLLNHIEGEPGRFALSPDGQWLQWINYQTGDGWPNPVAAHLDGTNYQDFYQDKAGSTYWLDSRRWVEQETRSYDNNPDSLELIVHDVQARRTQHIRLFSPQGEKLRRQHYDANQPYFAAESNGEDSRDPTVTIREYTVGDYYAPIEKKPLHTFSVRFPKGTWSREELVTNKGKRVVYRLHCAGDIGTVPNGYCDLWVSRVDGSHLHELGYVPENESDDEPSAWGSLQWLPDGKRVSFVYKNALYTVPVD